MSWFFKKVFALEPHLNEKENPTFVKPYKIPKRETLLESTNQVFDLVVIGSSLKLFF
jgi:hypothetical protein